MPIVHLREIIQERYQGEIYGDGQLKMVVETTNKTISPKEDIHSEKIRVIQVLNMIK